MWMVPLSFSSSKSPSETIHKVILDTKSTEVRLENIAPADWVKVNPGSVGFYRVQYPPEMLEQFKSAIASKVMPPLDRNGLVDDLFALVQAGDSSTVDFLRLAASFRDEDEFTVWSCLLSCLRRLRPLLQHTDMVEPYHAYCRRLLQAIHARLGWHQQDGESHMTTLLRPLVIAHLVSFDDEVVLAEAERLFRAHLDGGGVLHADLRSAAYRAVLKRGGKEEYAMMLKLYREAEMHEEKNRIAHALGSIPDVSLLSSVLEFALSDEVRAQESVFVMISVSSNRIGRDLTWDFYKQNWQILCDRYKAPRSGDPHGTTSRSVSDKPLDLCEPSDEPPDELSDLTDLSELSEPHVYDATRAVVHAVLSRASKLLDDGALPGVATVHDVVRSWRYAIRWRYCVDFLRSEEERLLARHVFQVRFSIPEHHQPIPKAVAYVFFFLTVPKSQFSNAPVEVFYMMETSRMRHVPGKTSFQEKWLIDIVNVKLKFWREIKF
ncbi:puromycin-sensitive aminopeptidase-like [Pollicipes pollicipes]|uniref:puromycin-sensitive aminopeptidase-like n=1 Tax=Pollicipes pollicipes TaxID=41117 RepID=UPI001884CF65|nr:puromycin-sensitive aminopeptidase-like [Pollicipes pollicipes]